MRSRRRFNKGHAQAPFVAGFVATGLMQQVQQSEKKRREDNEKNWNLLDVVGRIAEQHETTHAAVSLAWLLAQPQTSSIIVGARTDAQLEDNLRALAVKLTSENLKELDEASRPDWDYPWDVLRDAEAGDAQLLT